MGTTALAISMVANKHDLILDMTRDNTNDVPDRRNLGVDCGSDE
jgi:hypothetical protein